MKKRLELELGRYHDIVYGKILYQDDSLRRKGFHPRIIESHNGYQVVSESSFKIGDNFLMIRGTDTHKDEITSSYKFDTEQESINWIENITKLIDRINNIQLLDIDYPIGKQLRKIEKTQNYDFNWRSEKQPKYQIYYSYPRLDFQMCSEHVFRSFEPYFSEGLAKELKDELNKMDFDKIIW